MSRAGTPTDNPIMESINGWMKDEMYQDFDLKHCDDIKIFIETYIHWFNNERPAFALQYKTPSQYKTEMGYWVFLWTVYFWLTSSPEYPLI